MNPQDCKIKMCRGFCCGRRHHSSNSCESCQFFLTFNFFGNPCQFISHQNEGVIVCFFNFTLLRHAENGARKQDGQKWMLDIASGLSYSWYFSGLPIHFPCSHALFSVNSSCWHVEWTASRFHVIYLYIFLALTKSPLWKSQQDGDWSMFSWRNLTSERR